MKRVRVPKNKNSPKNVPCCETEVKLPYSSDSNVLSEVFISYRYIHLTRYSIIASLYDGLKDRLAEHQRAVKNLTSSSEIVNHMLDSDHRVDWEGAEILNFEDGHQKRLFKESWFSRVYDSGNRVFYDLNSAWNALV